MEEEYIKYYHQVYEDVLKMFQDNSDVEVFRGTFAEWNQKNPDVKLDWVYIDGDHSETGCTADLNLAIEVCKEDGIILGDDYKIKPGVTRAVAKFSQKFGIPCQIAGRGQFIFHLGKNDG